MIAISRTAQASQAAIHPEPRLVKAAHEFEAQLMNELLKPMTHSSSLGDDPEAGSEGALADFATEALGQALSQQGGLGIAGAIIRNLSRNESSPTSVPGLGTPESKSAGASGRR